MFVSITQSANWMKAIAFVAMFFSATFAEAAGHHRFESMFIETDYGQDYRLVMYRNGAIAGDPNGTLFTRTPLPNGEVAFSIDIGVSGTLSDDVYAFFDLHQSYWPAGVWQSIDYVYPEYYPIWPVP